MKIKIMEYNILNGFHTEKEPFTYEPDRQGLAVKVIKEENPDILVLCEANFARPSKYKILNNYQKIFGLPYYYVSHHSERSCTAVLSKFSMDFEDYALRHRPFLRFKFDLDRKRIIFDIVHPHPEVGDAEKVKFFRSVLRDRTDPYIIVGDFNALSPEDYYKKNKLINGFKRIFKKMKIEETKATQFIEDFLKRNSIKTILDDGLIDTFKVKNKKWAYTIPTDYLSLKKDTGTRIDYIFCSEDFRIIDAGIIKNKLTEMASDHYPIYAILEI